MSHSIYAIDIRKLIILLHHSIQKLQAFVTAEASIMKFRLVPANSLIYICALVFNLKYHHKSEIKWNLIHLQSPKL